MELFLKTIPDGIIPEDNSDGIIPEVTPEETNEDNSDGIIPEVTPEERMKIILMELFLK
jgi:hypothetical protein